ncbi:MAG: class I SAM-dependent methyltransferase [Deltaproteobacteria bacterium]|nr:class I SAM-dependent methyltransferase [Deltaproteobacteria bacterium]MBN2674305.1 class I SAM-dependent methyltransferase [Deltaproteobacteria bacterium]
MMSERNRLYNLLHTGNPGDASYYARCCNPEERVLEIGCGNGRIAKTLCDHGCLVQGIDNDPEMVEAFQTHTASLTPLPACHLADMRSFALSHRFDKVIIPFNGLLCMTSEADVIRALQRAAAHLEEDGELIFDMYFVPDNFQNTGEEEESYIDTTVLDDNGTRIEVYEKTLVGTDPQRFDTSYIFVANPYSSDEKQFEMTIAQRCIYINQLPTLLGAASLKMTTLSPDFQPNAPITEDTEQIVVHARKKDANNAE